MVKISLPRILEKTGPGRQVELPPRTHFSPKKSHGSLNLDGKCPLLSLFRLWHTNARKRSGRKNPNWVATGLLETEKQTRLLLLSPLHLHPFPALSCHPAPLSTLNQVTFVWHHRYEFHTVSKWESSELKQPKDRLLPVVFLSLSPASFLSLDHYGRLINKHKTNWSKRSESQDTSTKYVTAGLFLGDRLRCRLKVNLMKTLLWEKGRDRPRQPGRWAQNNGRVTDALHLRDNDKVIVGILPSLSNICAQSTTAKQKKREGRKSFH